jgi:surface protein
VNNGIVASDYAAPIMPEGLLGKATATPTPRGTAQRFRYDPSNLVLVFDTSLEPANLQVTVPIQGVSPNVVIAWGDGSSEAHTVAGNKTHTYAAGGIYVVQISGVMRTLLFGGSGSTSDNKQKLVRCLSFGDIGLTSLLQAFRSCVNLIEVPLVLPRGVTTLEQAFFGCTSFNDPNICKWKTENVTSFSNVFNGCSVFNQPIGSWDTSSATTFTQMFQNATVFNQPIGNWNTSRVQTITGMFTSAAAFNQQIGGWDTSNVTGMLTVFSSATSFRATLMGWNVSNVNNMNQMFVNSRYDQDISAWDIRKVTSLSSAVTAQWGTANYSAALIAWAALPDEDLRTQAITAFASTSGGTETRVTSNNHGMAAGSRVNISGTTNYNGDYTIASATTNTFDIPTAFVANDATGTMKHRRSRGVTFGPGASVKYSAAAASARATLVNTYGWVITDGGQE